MRFSMPPSPTVPAPTASPSPPAKPTSTFAPSRMHTSPAYRSARASSSQPSDNPQVPSLRLQTLSLKFPDPIPQIPDPVPKKRCGTLSPRQTPHTLLTLFDRATRHTRVVTTPQVSRKSPAPLSFRPIAGLYSIFPGASQALLGLSDRRLLPPPDTQKLPTLRHFRTSFHRYL